jgi:flagellar hook protein FlgE
MSVTSMFTAVSGMNVNGRGLAVVGDNIANMNTHGFKSSAVVFGDIVSQSGSLGIGRGALINDVSQEFTQGAFENTPNVLDLAIDGDGLFVVKRVNDTFYTRAGQFGIDKQGYASNPDGYKLQGYQFDVSGSASTVVGDVNVASINSQPNDTADVSVYANLDSRTNTTANPAFDVNNAAATSHFTSTVTTYDSLGNAHVVNIYYRKNQSIAAGGIPSATGATQGIPYGGIAGDNWPAAYGADGGTEWEWFAVTSAADNAAGVDEIQAKGRLEFNTNGALYHMETLTAPTGGFDFAGGSTQNQQIVLDFGDEIAIDGATGLEGTTQFGSTSTTSYLEQDGYSAGTLKSLSINEEGLMSGIFTNGQTKNIAQVVVAKFISQEGLIKQGNSLYAESYESGQPIVTAPGNSGTGNILSNTLELSNVDLAAEFVKMIIMQRGFQANSRMVSTSDELMTELVNLKR